MKTRSLTAATVLALLLGGAATARGAELALLAGVFDTAGDQIGEAGVELRFADKLPFAIGLLAGASANADSGYWVHAGFNRPFHLGERWRWTPFTGACYYEKGDGKELGYELEFRSGLEVAYHLRRAWIGLAFYHLSNASIKAVNPGSNSLVLTAAWPLGG